MGEVKTVNDPLQPSWTTVVVTPMSGPSLSRPAAVVWPEQCCCCGSNGPLGKFTILAQEHAGSADKTTYIDIPDCEQCRAHRSGSKGPILRAFALFAVGAVALWATISVLPREGILISLPLLLLAFIVGWVFVIKTAKQQGRDASIKGTTPTCTATFVPPVALVSTAGGRWKFLFANASYASRFATSNLDGSVETGSK